MYASGVPNRQSTLTINSQPDQSHAQALLPTLRVVNEMPILKAVPVATEGQQNLNKDVLLHLFAHSRASRIPYQLYRRPYWGCLPRCVFTVGSSLS